MPGKIQQSLGMLTAYLNKENERLDQEIKDKSLDVFLSKASGVFKTLDADATPDDARERYFQLLGIAGNMEVGKEATPFLNQMLSSSVAFIKDNQAEKKDKAFLSAVNQQFNYNFSPEMGGENAGKMIGLDMAATKEFEQTNKEGQVSYGIYKKGGNGFTYESTISKDERTDKQRLDEKIRLAKIQNSGQQFATDRPNPSTYTATFNYEGKPRTFDVVYKSGIKYYQVPGTAKLEIIPADAVLDQKMSSATINNSSRGTYKMSLETAQFGIETYGKGLALMLKNNDSSLKKNVYDFSAGEYITGNESFMYANKDLIAREILAKYPTDANISEELRAQRDTDLDILNSFVAQYDNYLNIKGSALNFSSDVTGKPEVNGVELNDLYKETSDIIERELNPETRTSSVAYTKISGLMKKHKKFYDAGWGTSYKIWVGKHDDTKLSPEQRSAILSELAPEILAARQKKQKENERLNKNMDLWILPGLKK